MLFSAPVDMRWTSEVASWSSVMESSSGVRRPHVRGTSITESVDVSVYWEVRDAGRSQSLGILAKTESHLDLARVCQSAMCGVGSIMCLLGEGLVRSVMTV